MLKDSNWKMIRVRPSTFRSEPAHTACSPPSSRNARHALPGRHVHLKQQPQMGPMGISLVGACAAMAIGLKTAR